VNRNGVPLQSKRFNHLPNVNVKGKCKGKTSENTPLCCLPEKDSYNLEAAADKKEKIKPKYVTKNNNESTTNLFHTPGRAYRFPPLSGESSATGLCRHARSRNDQ